MKSTIVVLVISLLGLAACASSTGPDEAFSASLIANKTVIAEGESVAVHWIIKNADGATLEPGYGTVILDASGSADHAAIFYPTATTEYTLTAWAGDETVTRKVTVTVN